jgi:hypothetical protein
VIDVLQKQVEGGDPLRQSAFDDVPVGRRHDARQQVVRKDALGGFVPAVDRERDSLVEEREIRLLLAAKQLLRAQLEQLLVQLAIRAAGLRLAVEHLIEGVGQGVARKYVGRGLNRHWLVRTLTRGFAMQRSSRNPRVLWFYRRTAA